MKETTTKTTKATVNKTTAKKVTDKVATTKTNKQLPKPVIQPDDLTYQTSVFNPNTRECLKQQSVIIKREIAKGQQAFIKVGHALNVIASTYSEKYFKDMGYKNIYRYAELNYGIAKGTCSELMRIAEQFCKYENGRALPELDEKYEKFSPSKLAVMITLPDEELKQCAPSMTVREIKNLKKKAKAGQTDASEKSEECEQMELDDIIDNDVEVSNVVISFRTVEEYEKNIDRLDELILRCLKAGHKVTVSETAQKVRTSEQKGV